MATRKSTATRRPGQSRERNHQWKGGRVVASNGYVLVKVGFDHHLADVRGYAYEHRLIAEQKAGRELREGEQIHHVNGDKQDNRPENIEIMESVAHHKLEHRSDSEKSRLLRLPGEPNMKIKCLCGCGQALLKFDDSGRPRKYVSGHNPQTSPVQNAVLAALQTGPMKVSGIAITCGSTTSAVKAALSKLRSRGVVTRLGRGIWRIDSHDQNKH